MHCLVCNCFESHISVLTTFTNYYKSLSAPLSDTVVAIKLAGLDHSFAFLGWICKEMWETSKNYRTTLIKCKIWKYFSQPTFSLLSVMPSTHLSDLTGRFHWFMKNISSVWWNKKPPPPGFTIFRLYIYLYKYKLIFFITHWNLKLIISIL